MPDTRPKNHTFNSRCPIQSRLQSLLGMCSLNVERNNWKVSLFALYMEASFFCLCAVAVENDSCLKLRSKLVIIKDWGMRAMISIQGSLSSAKLVVMPSAPCKICGGCQIRVPRSIHSTSVILYNLDSNLYEECVLSTSNATSWSKRARASFLAFV